MSDELTPSKDRLLAASGRLSVVERVDLFLALREELRDAASNVAEDPAGADEFSSEQLFELDRRLARHEADAGATTSWEVIEREIDERYEKDR